MSVTPPAIHTFVPEENAIIASPSGQDMSAPEAAGQVEAGRLVLLDIRSPQEWEKSGVARGALPISMHEPDFPKRLQEVLSRVPPERVGLIRATDGRSIYVAEILDKNGMTGVVDVSEGMFGNGKSPGWIARGLPVFRARESQDNDTLWRLSEIKADQNYPTLYCHAARTAGEHGWNN